MNLLIDIEDEDLFPPPSDDVLNALFADGFSAIAFGRIHANDAHDTANRSAAVPGPGNPPA